MIAKGDSKRLPRKNVLPLWGAPMLKHNLEKLKLVFADTQVYLSTEDEEIMSIGRDVGVIVLPRNEGLCGDTPDISVYKHVFAKKGHDVYGFVAVHADTPLTDIRLINNARSLIESGVEELMTCHPMTYGDDYKAQHNRIYGSVRGMSLKRLAEYEDPYRPRPEVLLVDPSPEIETREDYDKVRCSTYQ